MTRFFFSGIFFFTAVFHVSANFTFDEHCKNACNDIISLKINSGLEHNQKARKANPANKLPYLIDNYADFLSAFLSEEDSLFELLDQRQENRLDRLAEGDQHSPFYLYSQAEVYLQCAFARMKFREYYTAAYEIHKAWRLLKKNRERFPSFLLNQKTTGFLHALVGAVPEEYKWITAVVGMTGTIHQGVEELNDFIMKSEATEFSAFRSEALFLLSMIEINLMKDESGASALYDRFQPGENLLLCFAKANMAMKTGKNDEAVLLLQSRPSGKEYFPFHYLDYMTGVAMLNRLDAEASVYFNRFIKNFKGKSYIRAAWQKLAWHSLVHGNADQYKEFINHCKSTGSPLTDEDKQALKEAESATVPNVILLKARLLTDGGYYRKALAHLTGKTINDFPSLKDRLELTYRIGRIYHNLKEYDKALSNYESTISNGKSSSYYFAANAALQSGMIYELRGDKVNAKRCYDLCLSMRNHEYQNSIDQKAEAGLNRIGK